MWQHLLFITSFVGQKSVIFIYFCPVIQEDAPSCTQLKILLCCVAPVGYKSYLGSWKLTTHPSPKSTLSLTSHLGQNVGLGEG